MRKRALSQIDGLLNSLFKDLGISERIKVETLRRQWRNIFDEPLSMHTAPLDMKGGKLVIAVDSPAWLQHLKFLKSEMAGKLERYGIKAVQLKLGSVRAEENIRKQDRHASAEEFRSLTDDDLAYIKQTVAGIDDMELRESVRRAMERASSRKKNRGAHEK